MAFRRKSSGAEGPVLRATGAARALVVHPDEADAGLLDFAARCAEEAGHGVVVLDVLPDTAPEALADVAEQLTAMPGLLRIIPARATQDSTLEFGAWVADRLARPVLAHEGTARVVAGGGLYIEPDSGRGWLLVSPDGQMKPHSRRFPAPEWECDAMGSPRDLGAGFESEPLPAGVWLRASAGGGAAYRRRLIDAVLPDVRNTRIVLGYPGSPMIPPGVAAEFWSSLPVHVRAAARFIEFGATGRGPMSYGEALADILNAAVVVGTGVPLFIPTAAGGVERRILLAEGTMLWDPYAEDFEYPPRASGGPDSAPTPIGARSPIPGLPEGSPGCYEYEDDAVLEVTRAGLWMRPARLPSNSSVVRAAPPHPERAEIVFTAGTPALTERMRRLAEQAVIRLDPRAQSAAVVLPAPEKPLSKDAEPETPAQAPMPATSPTPPGPIAPAPVTRSAPMRSVPSASPVPVAGPASASPVPSARPASGPPVPSEKPTHVPAASHPPAVPPPGAPAVTPPGQPAVAPPGPPTRPSPSARPRVQPVPRPGAGIAGAPGAGLEKERVQVRAELGKTLESAADSVARTLSAVAVPGLDIADDEVLTDLAALHLYLSGRARQLDDALRRGDPGPHVALARCVAAGLRRLPAYRGPVRLRTDLDPHEWEWYTGRRRFIERSFMPALTAARDAIPGRVEVSIWSATARRTALIYPVLPDQAVFLPGTVFTVLSVAQTPGPWIRLRELGDDEIGAGATARRDLDRLAGAVLEQAAADWGRAHPVRPLPPRQSDRFSSPPGLIARDAHSDGGGSADTGIRFGRGASR